MSPLYLLLLPALVYGKLIIDIDLSNDDEPLFDARGERTSVISDVERKVFKIEDEQLKKAIAKLTKETQPNDVFVKTTGKTFDLHKIHNWDYIKRTVKPIFTIKNKKCEAETKELTKSEITVASNWTVQGNISIDLQFLVYIHDEAKVDLNISSPFGAHFNKYRDYLKKLPAKKCDVVVDVAYYTTLRGRVAANYPAKRQNHYYWGYDVNYVLNGADLPTLVINNQTITITYYKQNPAVE